MKKTLAAMAALALALAAGSAFAETTYPSARPYPHSTAPATVTVPPSVAAQPAPYYDSSQLAYQYPTPPYSGPIWYDSQQYYDGVE